MKKNIIAHIGAPGIMLIACGYVTNIKPGPASVTSSIVLPCMCAMWPSVENTTKPDKMLVKQLMKLVNKASLFN